MIDNSTITLDQLVSKFEENDMNLDQIPEQLVDKYGYACLANALMFKEPKIPEYNLEVAEYIKSHNFTTLDSLISYIKNLPNDIDKLFGIFSYASLNIEYNVELSNSDENRSTTLEEVFITKKAICEGFAIFYQGMTKKVGIDLNRIIVKEYPNLSKGRSFDPLHEPKEIKPNHASMYIKIDGVPFISEPTWASGHLTKNQEFERSFRPNLFLVPLYKSLCDHFPCDEAQDLLDFKFSFMDFFQCIKIDPFGRYLKTESNPFVNITCESGYIQQVYSCIGPIDEVGFEMSIMKDNNFQQISAEGITSYEIIQTKLPKHPERCRFCTYMLFPQIGFYKIGMYIDLKPILTYYVNNQKESSGSIPVKYNPYHDVKFIPIIPKSILTTAENGAMIRFAIAKKRSNILWKIIKLNNEKSFEEDGEKIDSNYAKHIKLEIPFDNERYEIQLCLTFPSNGRYCVYIFVENELKKYSFIEYTRYFFDIIDVEPGKEYQSNPVYYMFKGRKFAPMKIFDDENEVIVKPNKSCYLVKDREQSIQFKTASISDELYFEFRKDGKTVIWPKVCANDGEFRQINFTIPEDYGEYHLKGWVNDSCCIDLLYMYSNIELKDPSEDEKKLLDELKSKINHAEQKKDNKKNEEEQYKKENEAKIMAESEEKINCEIETKINTDNDNSKEENESKSQIEYSNLKENESINIDGENEIKSDSCKEININSENENIKIHIDDEIDHENTNSEVAKVFNFQSDSEKLNGEKINSSNNFSEKEISSSLENVQSNSDHGIKSEPYKEIKIYSENEHEKTEIEKENQKLLKENSLLKRAIEKLLKNNKKLKLENAELKKENSKIKKENEDLLKDKARINNKKPSNITNKTNQLNNQKEIDLVAKETNNAADISSKNKISNKSDNLSAASKSNVIQECPIDANSIESNKKAKMDNSQQQTTNQNSKMSALHNKNSTKSNNKTENSITDKKKTLPNINKSNKPSLVDTKKNLTKNTKTNEPNKKPKKPSLGSNNNKNIISNTKTISKQDNNKTKQNDVQVQQESEKLNSPNSVKNSEEIKQSEKSTISTASNDTKPQKKSTKSNVLNNAKPNSSIKAKPRLSINVKTTPSNKAKNDNHQINLSDNTIVTSSNDTKKTASNNIKESELNEIGPNENNLNADGLNTSINTPPKTQKSDDIKVIAENSKVSSPISIKISPNKNENEKTNKKNSNIKDKDISPKNSLKISPSNKNSNQSVEIKQKTNSTIKLSNKQELNSSKKVKSTEPKKSTESKKSTEQKKKEELKKSEEPKKSAEQTKSSEIVQNKTKLNLTINIHPKIEINTTQKLAGNNKTDKITENEVKSQAKNKNITINSKSKLATPAVSSSKSSKPKPKITTKKSRKSNE